MKANTLSAILSGAFTIICVVLTTAIPDKALKWTVLLLFTIPYVVISVYWINKQKKKEKYEG